MRRCRINLTLFQGRMNCRPETTRHAGRFARMAVPARIRTTIITAIMMAAVVVSFAGPSIASTVRLLDDDGASAASEAHLPLDTAAAPDPVAEFAPESAEEGLSSRLQGDPTASSASKGETGMVVQKGRLLTVAASRGQALLCVYRL